MPKPSDDGELLNNQLYNSRGLTLWQLKLEKPWLLHQQRRIQTNNGPSGNLTWRKYQSWHKSFTFLGDGLLSYLIAAGLSQPSWNSWSTGTTEGFFPRWVASTYQSLCVHLDLYEKSRSHVDFSQNQTSQVGCFFLHTKNKPIQTLFFLLTTKPPILGFLFQPTNLSHPFPNVSGPTNSSDQFSRPQNMLTVFPMGSWKITAVLNMLIRWWTT